MAQLPSVFKTNDHDKIKGFDPIPIPWVIAEIEKSEYKQNSAKTGHHLTCQFIVLEPEEYKGKRVFNLLNLDNPNETTMRMANEHMTSMCLVCGLDTVEDSTELHGIPMGLRLTIEPGDANWPPKNKIKDYKPAEDVEFESDSPFDGDE